MNPKPTHTGSPWIAFYDSARTPCGYHVIKDASLNLICQVPIEKSADFEVILHSARSFALLDAIRRELTGTLERATKHSPDLTTIVVLGSLVSLIDDLFGDIVKPQNSHK